MKLRNTLVGLMLLGMAVGSSALSLGRARGAVVLGQPLDVGFDVRVDSAEHAVVECFRAEVQLGDRGIDASRLRILVQAAGVSPLDVVVRVRSSAVVDEPVVGVMLYSLCGQAGSRRYDFLSDIPVEMTTTAQVLPVAEPPIAAAPAAAQARRAAASAPSASRPQAATARARPAAAGRPPDQAGTTPGRSRLRLDAPAAAGSGLQRSTQLSVTPADKLPQRAEAAAVWRAMNTPAEDALRDSQRLAALEQQAKQAREARETLARDLRERLERAERRLDDAEHQRTDLNMVYGLIALLLLALAAAAYFWSRARRMALEAGHWAASASMPLGPHAGAASATGPTTQSAKSSMTAHPGDSMAGAVVSEPGRLHVGAGPISGRTDGAMAGAAAAAGMRRPAAPPVPRELIPEEFFDVQQHADFFVSLGQYDQAVDVLRKHVAEYGAASPLAFLELLKLYHRLNRQSDYNALRAEFQARFNVRVPNFAAFTDEGLALEDYPTALLSIESAWGEVRVLGMIEANIVRSPDDLGKSFDLAALRDLLLLYAVAKIALDPAGTAQPPTGFGRGALPGALDDLTLLPRRAARPDFSALLTPSDPRQAAAGGGTAVAAAQEALQSIDLELDSVPSPLAASSPEAQDLDLLNSQLHTLASNDALPPTVPGAANVSEVDIDLPLFDLEPGALDQPAPASGAADATKPADEKADTGQSAIDSNMIDFDLFDPNTGAQIAPKTLR